MTETSARLELPLLASGQAQKEVTHNEALTLLDLAVAPSVVASGVAVPPATPIAGQCWIVGTGASGAWTGADDAIAGWTAGGWRLVRPKTGMLAWVEEAGGFARYTDSGWTLGAPLGEPLAAIAAPAGGAVVDAEARLALEAIIAALQELGFLASP